MWRRRLPTTCAHLQRVSTRYEVWSEERLLDELESGFILTEASAY